MVLPPEPEKVARAQAGASLMAISCPGEPLDEDLSVVAPVLPSKSGGGVLDSRVQMQLGSKADPPNLSSDPMSGESWIEGMTLLPGVTLLSVS